MCDTITPRNTEKKAVAKRWSSIYITTNLATLIQIANKDLCRWSCKLKNDIEMLNINKIG